MIREVLPASLGALVAIFPWRPLACKRDLKLTSDDALFYKPWPDVPKDLTATQLAKSKKQKHHYTPGSAGNKKYKRMYGPKADLAKT
jgi:hypothetical protein